MSKTDFDVAIIGSGMGGLSCGAWLAHRGLKVLVLERHNKVGGLCSTFERAGFNFNPVATMIQGCKPNEVIGTLLRILGKDREIEFLPLDSVFKWHFPEHSLTMPPCVDGFQDELAQAFPHEAQNIARCFKKMKKLHRQLGDVRLLGTTLTSPAEVIGMQANVVLPRTGVVVATFQTTEGFLRHYLKDEKLLAILFSLAHAAVGMPASRLAILTYICVVMEYLNSCVYVKGGSQKIADVMVKSIEDNGGSVLLESEAKKILVEDGSVCGVEVEQEGAEDRTSFRTKYVVSNADAHHTFDELLGHEHLSVFYRALYSNMKEALSFFMVFLGLDIPRRELPFEPCMHIFSPSYTHFNDHYTDPEKHVLADEGGFLLPLAHLSDPDNAPKGLSSIVIEQVGVPYEVAGGWKNVKQRMADRMIKRVEQNLLPELSKHIVLREVASPLTVVNYTLNHRGAGGAWEDTTFQAGIFRMEQVTPVKGLYMTGHWTKPGGSVLGVTLSGLMVAGRILRDAGVDTKLSKNWFLEA